ncbi:L-lactate permease [Brachybacterium huguangmaarense]|uniref:L-lactate permease n=1 Tax=Brachybacterium huguangmaarense TaxID=1652028 RepID=A0ABY6G249_9MICO|nr:L-lactate permease [Brachybacterium huguangmaarense]UYG17286.1 L-lactate permease [Brachybacterium huguangmaarense]
MWTQNVDPLDHLVLSALVAAIPILVFLLCLVVIKLSGITAALIALGVECVIALAVFGMPAGSAAGAGLMGLLTAIWPIGYIIVMAVWLYRLAVVSGRFDVIRSSIRSISPDRRIQVLLISFAFGAFLEGAAGFGVPIAICAALLVQLGFGAVRAAMISLVANFAAGAYGAIGIPVLVGAQVSGLETLDVSRALVLLLQPPTLLVPFLLVFILDGVRGLRETFPAALVVTVVFNAVQAGILWTLGPELADLGAGLAAMLSIMALSRVWSPRRIDRGERADEVGTPAAGAQDAPTLKQVAIAWSPFYILTAFILLWSLPVVNSLFATGALAPTVFAVPIPGVTGAITTASGTVVDSTWSFGPLAATGTAILLAVIVTFLTAPSLSVRRLLGELVGTVRSLGSAIALIALILMFADITNYSGATASMGIALAATGSLFPLIAPIIGWIGVFLTGSVVNNNTLFAPLQVSTAAGIGADPALLVAANTAGGTAAKVISPQSIAIAAGAVGLPGREGEVLRASIVPSLVLLALTCGWCFVLSLLV